MLPATEPPSQLSSTRECDGCARGTVLLVRLVGRTMEDSGGDDIVLS